MSLTVTDLFCGGGGSSTGAIQVPGVSIRIAANHWDLAVEVHNQNHPTADHAAVDLHEEDPCYNRYSAMVIENVVDIATNPKFAEAWALWKKSLIRQQPS